MKAFAGVLAMLVVWSCASFGQTAAATATSTASADEAAAIAVSAAALKPGVKVFVDPMGGFGQLLADSIVHKKVPVVLVKDRAQADFVMSGEAHIHNRNFLTGMVLSTRGGANIAMKDARTGNQVFACNFHRVDSNERDGDIYLGWADQCAGHLKKALKKKK